MLVLVLFILQVVEGDICSNGSSADCMMGSNILISETGRPIDDKLNTLTVGPRGPMLLQDRTFLEEIAHFDRERIPNRVVHAKGSGAFGYFEVTDDVTRYTKAKLFDSVGKRTPIAVRFSRTAAEVGSADSVRGFRGMAIKFYTEEGNWDLVGNNAPVFPIRDPILFPSLVKTLFPDPVSNLRRIGDPFWDFVTLRHEILASQIFLYSDRGVPQSFRHMDGFGINTFKLVNATGTATYCKFSYLTDQGIRNWTREEGIRIAFIDPDIHSRDLFQAIEDEDFPSWTFYIQVMTMQETLQVPFNPFDPTKEWPEEEFPLIRVGKLVLDRNPKDHFAEVEQMALSPSNLIPGIEASPDKILQGRLFSYPDTQRYRLGANYQQLPVNCPFRSPPNNYERNGQMTFSRNQGTPVYYPNSYKGPVQDPLAAEHAFETCGISTRYDDSEIDNYSQARLYYSRLDEDQRSRMIHNIVVELRRVSTCVLDRAVAMFKLLDLQLGERIAEAVGNGTMVR